jgi:hypothetical protein
MILDLVLLAEINTRIQLRVEAEVTDDVFRVASFV